MSLRSSYHLQIISSGEGMFVILHHGEQQSFGHSILSVVRLPPVQIEIVQAGGLELTAFTVERFQLVVNITDVFPQLTLLVERFLTLHTSLPPLSPSVFESDVSPQRTS